MAEELRRLMLDEASQFMTTMGSDIYSQSLSLNRVYPYAHSWNFYENRSIPPSSGIHGLSLRTNCWQYSGPSYGAEASTAATASAPSDEKGWVENRVSSIVLGAVGGVLAYNLYCRWWGGGMGARLAQQGVLAPGAYWCRRWWWPVHAGCQRSRWCAGRRLVVSQQPGQ
ncbi:hypothetical protein CCP4SC76_4250007 [Gammaproteobacteria bacterium]